MTEDVRDFYRLYDKNKYDFYNNYLYYFNALRNAGMLEKNKTCIITLTKCSNESR